MFDNAKFAGRFSQIELREVPSDPACPYHVTFVLDGNTSMTDAFPRRDQAERFEWWLRREAKTRAEMACA